MEENILWELFSNENQSWSNTNERTGETVKIEAVAMSKWCLTGSLNDENETIVTNHLLYCLTNKQKL